jgi:hypothetical protein
MWTFGAVDTMFRLLGFFKSSLSDFDVFTLPPPPQMNFVYKIIRSRNFNVVIVTTLKHGSAFCFSVASE